MAILTKAAAGRVLAIARESEAVATFLGMPAVVASTPMRAVMHYVERIAQSNSAVLIAGESGTGKELIARALHQFSPRSTRAWIDVNCAALPDHLLESELFGYEKGAFSGADTAKPGMFELAHHGTLFLDEIAELNLKSQSKLLRVLDGCAHYRLGGVRKIEVDVRIVAATNAELEKEVAAGRFRADLFHRLNQVQIAVPPLRERTADIAPLARFFLGQHAPYKTLAEGTLTAMERYSWPGNVRELRNLMARLAVTEDCAQIGPEALPAMFHEELSHAQSAPSHSLDQLEQDVIIHALEEADGRRKRAAQMLGISQRTLIRRLKLYGVKPSRALPVNKLAVIEGRSLRGVN